MQDLGKDMIKLLENKSNWVRRKALDMAVNSGKAHLGGSYSCIDILVALYNGKILKVSPETINDKNRDRFILSKGHASLALYPILANNDFFPMEELETYGKEGTMLGGSVDYHINGIEMSSGSLGHGLSVGCGISLSGKVDKKNFNTYVLLGDGECNEGSIWESIMFASSQKLKNLTAIVDNNKLGATTNSYNYTGGSNLSDRWESFGWNVYEINGHDFNQIFKCFREIISSSSEKPSVVIANTIKGKGISFMENKSNWHHGVPKGDLLKQAYKDLGVEK